MNPIPYGRQNITEDDITEVVRVLKSFHLTQGPHIEEFEKNFANYVGAKYAVAVSNGTAALHLCAMALNVTLGDKVITTPITFSASANCIRYCGGEVVFADIDPETYLLDIKNVRSILEKHPKGTFKGIIPVDFAGRAVNLEEYKKLANEFGLWIIEDACHAPGGYFINSTGHKSRCGSGEYAELAIFSFHPVKHIACGEGGMITTNNEEHYKQLLRLRSHGITKGSDPYINSIEFATGGVKSEKEYPGWYMEMQQLGYNYRLTDIQAALGNSQLKRASSGIDRRLEIANAYNEAFQDKDYIKGQSGYIEGHAYHLYVIEVENRLGLFKELRKNNIFAQIHYIPVHLMPYYRSLGSKVGEAPNAESYYKGCISLPIYPTLSNEEQEYVIKTIHNFLS